jgi:hypothetical protein
MKLKLFILHLQIRLIIGDLTLYNYHKGSENKINSNKLIRFIDNQITIQLGNKETKQRGWAERTHTFSSIQNTESEGVYAIFFSNIENTMQYKLDVLYKLTAPKIDGTISFQVNLGSNEIFVLNTFALENRKLNMFSLPQAMITIDKFQSVSFPQNDFIQLVLIGDHEDLTDNSGDFNCSGYLCSYVLNRKFLEGIALFPDNHNKNKVVFAFKKKVIVGTYTVDVVVADLTDECRRYLQALLNRPIQRRMRKL